MNAKMFDSMQLYNYCRQVL